MHPLAPNQANAMRVLSRRCAKSSRKKTKTNRIKMECPVCYDMKFLVKINCNHSFCKPCLKNIIKTKENDINDNSFINCPLCRREVINTQNKSVNRPLNECNQLLIFKQKYPMMTIETIRNYIYFENKIDKIKIYPDKMKFKTYQHYIK